MDAKSKTPNIKLRYQRESRGWSQKRLADALDTSREMVSKWERGEQSPGKYYQEKLCELFGKSAQELGFISEPNQLAPFLDSNADQKLSENNDLPGVLTQAITQGIVKAVQELGNQGVEELHRKIVVPKQELGEQYIGFSTSRIFLDFGLLARLERVFAPHAGIDHTTSVFELKRQLVQGGGTNWPELLTTASKLLRFLTNLLVSHSEVDQHLTTFIGETCLLIGDVLFNLRDYQVATRYYEIALRAACEVSNITLQSIASGRYSLLLIDCHQSSLALPLMEEALRLAESRASSTIRSWLWAVKAEAHASRGEEKSCLEALEAAREQSEQHEEREHCYTFVPELVPYVYGTAKLLGYDGACYLRLKQPEQAQRVLTVSQKSSSHPHHQSLVNADFALALTQQNAPKDACIFAVQALTYVQQTHSARAFQRILSVRQALHPWNDLAEVKDLDERIFAATKEGV